MTSPRDGAGSAALAGLAPNVYLSGSISRLFIRTASPIIMLMALNGTFTLVDAWFLGVYVGPEALAAVTLMFPLFMIVVSLETLVATGFSSIFARSLGAGEHQGAAAAFWQAVTLSCLVSAALMLAFVALGWQVALIAANGDLALAASGHTYIAILIFATPVIFLNTLNSDALRAEGRMAVMTALLVASALLNVLFDWLFIARFGWGVAGSAWGGVAANLCAFTALLVYRLPAHRRRALTWVGGWPGTGFWRSLLALGAPTSLNYFGISVSAGLTLYCLQIWAPESYGTTAGAFGIINRLMTFMYLPLLGLGMALQSIAGNNYGAKAWSRANRSRQFALGTAFVYCTLAQIVFFAWRNDIGLVFVDDAAVAADIARILPIVTATLFLFGPMMMLGVWFQAIGNAKTAAILGLSRIWAFKLPLTVAMALVMGEPGIWYSSIVSELLMLVLTIAVLLQIRRRNRPDPAAVQIQPEPL